MLRLSRAGLALSLFVAAIIAPAVAALAGEPYSYLKDAPPYLNSPGLERNPGGFPMVLRVKDPDIKKPELPKDRPVTLDECVAYALGYQPKVKAAEWDFSAGQFRTYEGISAFWPSASFDASRSHQHSQRAGNVAVSTPASGISDAFSIQNDFAFTVNWTLFDFGRTYYGVKSLESVEGSLLRDLSAAQQGVVYDTMTAYFGLLATQSLVKVSEESLANANNHLKQAQAFFEVGTKPKFDVTSAEVEVNTALLQLIQAKDAVKAARAALNTTLGIDPLTPTAVAERPSFDKLDRPVDSYIKEAMANRPEIQSQKERVRSNEFSVLAAVSDYKPSISATATQDWSKLDHGEMLSNQALKFAVDVPLFNGFRTTSRVGETRAGVLSSRYRLEDLENSVKLDVTLSFVGYEDAQARVDTLDASVKKAQENLDIARGRYDAGVGSIIEVNDAQVSLTQAQTDKVKAVFDYNSAIVKVFRSTGKPVK